MKTFKVTVEIFSLVGTETREIEVEAKTEKSARAQVAAKMGNREHVIVSVESLGDQLNRLFGLK